MKPTPAVSAHTDKSFISPGHTEGRRRHRLTAATAASPPHRHDRHYIDARNGEFNRPGLLHSKNIAQALFSSTAAIDITLVHEAGQDRVVLPSLPVAAIDKVLSNSRLLNASASVQHLQPPRSGRPMRSVPALTHVLTVITRLDEWAQALAPGTLRCSTSGCGSC